jgi:hypothetical protein
MYVDSESEFELGQRLGYSEAERVFGFGLWMDGGWMDGWKRYRNLWSRTFSTAGVDHMRECTWAASSQRNWHILYRRLEVRGLSKLAMREVEII